MGGFRLDTLHFDREIRHPTQLDTTHIDSPRLFFTQSEKREFAANIITVVKAVESFQTHCVGFGLLHKGEQSDLNIRSVITTVKLISMLIPSPMGRFNAINYVKEITITNEGKVRLICGDKGWPLGKDCAAVGSIINLALRDHLLSKESHLQRIGSAHKRATDAKGAKDAKTHKGMQAAGGLEGLIGRDLSHLKRPKIAA